MRPDKKKKRDARFFLYKEDDGYKMADGCEVDEQMPNKVKVWSFFFGVKPSSNTIEDAT